MVHFRKLSRRDFGLSSLALASGAALPLAAGAQAPQPFRIGSLNSMTGVGGPYGPYMLEAARIAVDEVNALGGAAGRQLVMFSEDDQTRTDAGLLATKKMIEINKVEAIISVWSSAVCLAIMPTTDESNVIMMNTCGSPDIPKENHKGLSWIYFASNAVFARAYAEIARRRGFKRPAVMAFNNSTFVGQAHNFRDAWEQGGGKLSSLVIYEPNQSSYRTELNSVLATKPDVIVLGSYRPDASILLKEWYQSGYDCKFIMPGWTANEGLIKALGKEVLEGVLSVHHVPKEKHPAFQHLASEFRRKTGKEADMYASQAYDMVITLALAVEAAGPNATTLDVNRKIREVTTPPGQKVTSFAEGRDALRAGKKIDYDGASSDVNFGERGDAIPDFGVFEIVNGNLELRETILGSSISQKI